MRLRHVCGGCGIDVVVVPLHITAGGPGIEDGVKFEVAPCTRCRAQLIEQIRTEEVAKWQDRVYREGGAHE